MPDRKFVCVVTETVKSEYEVMAPSATAALLELGARISTLTPRKRETVGRRTMRPVPADRVDVLVNDDGLGAPQF